MADPTEYSADEIGLSIGGSAGSIEEAFAWVIAMIDRHDLREPRIDIVPTWSYGPHPDDTGTFWFQVSVSGSIPEDSAGG